MTWSEEVVLAWMRAHEWHLAPSAGAQADLARRIDAALAAVEAEREKYRAMWTADASGCIAQAARVWKCDPNVDVTLNVEEAIDRLQAALAEREAQCAALREQLSEAYDILTQTDDFEAAQAVDRVLTDTATAARAFVERIREECAQIALAQPYYPDTHTGMRQQWVKEQIAAAIRALGPKEE